uniref:Uncharacterized protein n=1 Tax=Noctiluca scintillans TaxID=2966 RepID=A0A7S1AGS4_NOCSC
MDSHVQGLHIKSLNNSCLGDTSAFQENACQAAPFGNVQGFAGKKVPARSPKSVVVREGFQTQPAFQGAPIVSSGSGASPFGAGFLAPSGTNPLFITLAGSSRTKRTAVWVDEPFRDDSPATTAKKLSVYKLGVGVESGPSQKLSVTHSASRDFSVPVSTGHVDNLPEDLAEVEEELGADMSMSEVCRSGGQAAGGVEVSSVSGDDTEDDCDTKENEYPDGTVLPPRTCSTEPLSTAFEASKEQHDNQEHRAGVRWSLDASVSTDVSFDQGEAEEADISDEEFEDNTDFYSEGLADRLANRVQQGGDGFYDFVIFKDPMDEH